MAMKRPEMAPRVGVQIRPNHVSWGDMKAAWQYADGAGADSIWTFDHFFPIDGDPEGTAFECWATLAAMASVTKTAMIGPLVTCTGFRNPDLLADMARTVDHASGGRVVLGLGSGWLERDYYSYGYAMSGDADRIREMEVAIHRIRRRLGQLRPGPMGPLPILIGGLGERMTLDVCARLADAWNGWGTPDEIARLNSVLDGWCERAERDPSQVERTVALFETASDATYDDYAAAGAEHLILVCSGPDYQIEELGSLLAWRDSRSGS